MTTKKIFIITLILFILTSGSLAVYNFFLKDKGEPAPRDDEQNDDLGRKPKPISKDKVFAPTIGQDDRTVKYYLQNSGRAFQSAFDGSGLNPVSTADLSGLTKIVWSPDKTKVISFFETQGTTKKYVYDYQTKISTLLNENIKTVSWSPDGQKIAYQFQIADGSAANISVANPDGSQWRNIFQTRLENLVVEWPAPTKISLRSRPSGLSAGFLFTLDPETQDFKKILSDINGLSSKWSLDSQKIIYSATDQKGKNLKLYVAQADGGNGSQLPTQTLVEKCVWSKDNRTVFCAVPQKISENAVWPDDYFLNRVAVKDDIYLIDTTNGEKTKIFESSAEYTFDVAEMLLSPMEDYLLFVNRSNGLLYSLGLK